jgi:hypothetical protein
MKHSFLLFALFLLTGFVSRHDTPGFTTKCKPPFTSEASSSSNYILSAPATTTLQDSREIITIRWLSKTLIRMGETKIAKRLVEDYYTNKTVSFGAMNSADGNAETGLGLKGKNCITLSTAMLNTADLDRMLKDDPYGNKSTLINDAMTVVHEYVHMDQTLPMNYPTWEDPAWQQSDKTLSAWTKKIEAEYLAARKLPESPSKKAKLAELNKIIDKLAKEAMFMRNSIGANEKNGSLSPNQRWLLDDTDKRLKALKEATKKYENFGKLNTPVPQKDKGYWEMVSWQAFDKLGPGDNNYSLSASDGTLKAKWTLSPDVFDITATYTVPPKKIYPSDKLPMQMSVSVSNSGDQYSANGDFSFYFDNPDVEPGFAASPISMVDAKGVAGYIRFSHKAGIPITPAASMDLSLDGSKLPAGSKGKRIALLAVLYNGRATGYKYVYEWKDSW